MTLKNQSGFATVILFIILLLGGVSATSYLIYKGWYNKADMAHDQPQQNAPVNNTAVAFTPSTDHIKSDSLQKVGNYTTDGNKITIFAAIGGPVGCKDELSAIEKEGEHLVVSVQATSVRTKIFLPVHLSAILEESFDSAKVRINLLRSCP